MRAVAVIVSAGCLLGGALVGTGGTGAASAATPAASATSATSVAVAAGSPIEAALPAGWSRAGGSLTWTSPRPLPLTSAGVQFYSGQRLLGFPAGSPDGRRYSLRAEPGSYDPAALGAFGAGRRLDVPAAVSAAARRRAKPAAAPSTATPKLTTSTIDPGLPGRYATRSGTYTLPSVSIPGLPKPVEMLARVVSPKGAPGSRPMVLFLHGRHSICYRPGKHPSLGDQVWPCPAGELPIPSYLGYLKAQRLLASQGYVTVSIAANGINGQDDELLDGGAQARSSLVRLHLGRWADWSGEGRASAPAAVRAAPPVNLAKVLLVGHSRGGEGVARAALDSINPPPAALEGYPGTVRWTVRGVFLLAPTAFGHDPAADVPSVTLLPGCDGDVFDQQGQMYIDAARATSSGTALHSAVHVVGADHNFFNSQWTPKLAAAPADDDWFNAADKLCGTAKKVAGTSARLSPAVQQDVGATYVAAAARLFLAGDDRVRPLLDGSPVRPASLRSVQVATSVLGLRRTPLVLPAAASTVKASGGTTARVCKQAGSYGASGSCLRSDGTSLSPNFTPFVVGADDPDRQAIALSWTRAGSRATLRTGVARDLSRSSSVALRLIVPPNSTGTLLEVAVLDSAGKRATLGQVRPVGLPGTAATVSYWAQELRVPLAGAASKVDLKHIVRLELVPRSTRGRAWLLDAWGRASGSPAPRSLVRTRVDVGDLGKQPEGDTKRTVLVPLTGTGGTGGTVRVFIEDSETGKVTSSVLTVPAGGTVDVPVRVEGDSAFGYDDQYSIYARALTGTVVGAWAGGLTLTDDDPMPTLSVAAVTDDVVEGGTLRWRLTLSGPAESELTASVDFLKPVVGKELSTTDVKASWVRGQLFTQVLPSRGLSKSKGYMSISFPAGKLTADLTVPTVTDTLAESTEYVRAGVFFGDSELPTATTSTATTSTATTPITPTATITGSVRDG